MYLLGSTSPDPGPHMLEAADQQTCQLVLPAVYCPGTGQRQQHCISTGKMLLAVEGFVCATSFRALDSLHAECCYFPAIATFTGQILRNKGHCCAGFESRLLCCASIILKLHAYYLTMKVM